MFKSINNLQKINLFFASFFLILFISCEKDSEENADITGSWKWIISYGAWGGTYTPESTNSDVELEFRTDFIYKEYHNDSLFLECKFQLKEPEDGYTMTIIEYDTLYNNHQFEIYSNDTLLLYDNRMTDGFTRVYIRLK
jgi:hypothetical protein